MLTWYGAFASAKTPKPVGPRLSAEVEKWRKVVRDAKLKMEP